MKKYISLLLLIPFLSFKSTTTKVDIVGKWKGTDKGKIGYLIFESNGYFTMKTGNTILGGKNFTLKKKSVKSMYNYNADKNPIEIDLIIYDMNDKIVKKMSCIAEFKDKNTMKLGTSFSSDKRPTTFEDITSTVLTRVTNDE